MNRHAGYSKVRLVASVVFVLLGAGAMLAGLWSLAVPASAAPLPPTPEVLPGAGLPAPVAAPAISTIDSPTAQCYRPEEGKDACFVTWNYLYVSAAPDQYMISMTISIDGRMRANLNGFFQNAMYLPGDFFGRGFKVHCGPPGTSGDPRMGQAYSYQIQARDTANLKATNYGQVTCPSDIVPLAGVELAGPAYGRPGVTYPFTVTVSPFTATLPISYNWQVSGQGAHFGAGGVKEMRQFHWNSAGEQTIRVTAANPRGTYTATATIIIQAPVSGLSAANDGPTVLGEPTEFSALAEGSDLTYAWDFGNGETGLGETVSYIYPATGVYTATVTASNQVSSASTSTQVIVQQMLFLPVLRRN